MGAEVVTTEGRAVGQVREVFETEPAHLLEVKGDGKVHLIPFTEQVVKEVDVERKRISLTLRLDDEVPAGDGQAEGKPRGGRAQGGNQGGGGRGRGKPGGGKQGRQNRQGGRGQAPAGGAMADALRKAGYGG